MRSITKIAYYEVLHILKDPILFVVVFLAPIAYVTLFGAVYFSGLLSNIPMAIVDLDHSELSREIENAYANSPYFNIVEDVDTYEELQTAMQMGEIRSGVVIPEDLQKNTSLHRHTEVLTVYDGSNLIWGYNIQKKNIEVIKQFNSENTVAYLAGKGLSSVEISSIVNAVDFNITVWYNPNINYTYFLFMGLVMMILHQLGLLSVSLTVSREKERHSWSQYLSSVLSVQQIIMGKCLPYFIINFFNYTLLLWISAQFIHVKIEGGVLLIIILGLLYDIIITFTGFFISLKAYNSLQITRCLLLLSIPLFFLSGYTWPWAYMYEPISSLGKIMPYSWMAKGFRMVTLKNLGIAEVGVIILVMVLMALAAIIINVTFNKTQKPVQETPLSVNAGNSYPRKRHV